MRLGLEFVVEASGCSAEALSSLRTMRALLDAIITDLGLNVVGEPHWHQFPGPGGVTGLYLLSESHLACHTYPEHNAATFNLYCCRERPHWDWARRLQQAIDAKQVNVKVLQREIV